MTDRDAIVAVGLSHKTAGLRTRERAALDDPQAREVLRDLHAAADV